MREILFRGKRVDNGEWITGDLIANSASPFVFIRADVGLKVDDPIRGKDIKVIQDTIGQFTGLTDKNGKRIFEGDVLERTVNIRNYAECDGIKKEIYEVEYTNFELLPFSETSHNIEEFEVIGNVHDNPELI